MNIYTEIHKLQKLIKGVRCSATEVLLSTTVQDGDAVAGCYKFAINTTSETLFYKDLNGLWKSVDGILGTTTEILSGGIVTWIANYDYDVSAAVYKINGVVYTSPQTTITLDPSDPLLDRIDTFVLTSSGTAIALTGTPDANPVSPTPNPVSQIGISIALVMAGTTEPGPVANNLWTDSGNHIYNTNVGNVGIGGIPNLAYAWAPKLHVFGNIQANGGLNISTASKTGIYGASNDLEFWNGNNKGATFTLLASSPGSYFTFNRAFVVGSGSGTQNAMRVSGSVISNGVNSMLHNQLLIDPIYNHQSLGTGLFRGIYYNPIIQDLNGAQHIAWENTSGDVIFGHLAGASPAPRLLQVDVDGKLALAYHHAGNLWISGGFSTGVNSFEVEAPGNNGVMLDVTPLDGARRITFDMPPVVSGSSRTYTFQDANGTLAFTSDFTLDAVLTNDNASTQDAKVGKIWLYNIVDSDYNYIATGDSSFTFKDAIYNFNILNIDSSVLPVMSLSNKVGNTFSIGDAGTGITDNRNYYVPDISGGIQVNSSSIIDVNGHTVFLTTLGCYQLDDTFGSGKVEFPDPTDIKIDGGEIILLVPSNATATGVVIQGYTGNAIYKDATSNVITEILQGEMFGFRAIAGRWRAYQLKI